MDWLKIIIFTNAPIFLCLPTDLVKISFFLVVGVMISLIIGCKFYKKANNTTFIRKNLFAYDLAIVLFLMDSFYHKWIVSSKISLLAHKFHISTNVFLIFIICLVGILSLHSIDVILGVSRLLIIGFFEKSISKPIVTYCNKHRILFLNSLQIIIIAILQCLQLQSSSLGPINNYGGLNLFYFLWSICFFIEIYWILTMITQKWTISIMIVSVLTTIFSIVNYYVIQFHGSPLYISEFKNLKTAINVAGAYDYKVSFTVLFLVGILFAEFSILKNINNKPLFCNMKKRLFNIAGMTFLLCILLFGGYQISLKNNAGWSWEYDIEKKGFVAAATLQVLAQQKTFIKPETYDSKNLEFSEWNYSSNTEEKPDIFLILNETFCDLNINSDISTDIDYLEEYQSIPNAIYGHTVVPKIGGGTNDSEYELLSSKTMFLLPVSSPFQYLSSILEERTIVKYLSSLGYTTNALHCGDKTNYSRNIAYPAMGFDNISLGADSFENKRSYGKRIWLDEDNYKDMLSLYEAQKDEGPQFFYLLTYQNHGGYEQNDDKMDIVHCYEDYGNLTDDINEYLTSIKMSSDAFKQFTSYFSDSKRKVIICMVGDHAPSFISDLRPKSSYSVEMTEISKRSVPFVIWTNCGLYDTEQLYTEYSSMVDLCPMILYTAGLPLSPFYQTILNMHQSYPVRLQTGTIMDSDGKVGKYDSNNNKYDVVTQYLNLVYNSMLETGEYNKKMFEVTGK